MSALRVQAPQGRIDGKISLPASKSIANRLLILNALTNEPALLQGLSESEDTLLLYKILKDFRPEIDAADAGTVFRFLTAFLACKPGKWFLTGSNRMLERPIGPLVNALKQAGAEIEWKGKIGFPPLFITGKKIQGGTIALETSMSSQFVSAILMIAPLMERGLVLQLKGRSASVPYILMTLSLMKQMGAKVEYKEDSIVVLPGEYKFNAITVEKDWSSAAFWFELCGLSEQSTIELMGLQEVSIQGDAVILKIIDAFRLKAAFNTHGVKLEKNPGIISNQVFKMNCRDVPDLVPALVCLCAGLGIESHFSGVQTLRLKESDRIHALQSELKKLGLKSSYDQHEDILHLQKGKLTPYEGVLHTHKDHRIAMSLALLSVICGPLVLDDGDVVVKSYPSFWEQLRNLGFLVEHVTV